MSSTFDDFKLKDRIDNYIHISNVAKTITKVFDISKIEAFEYLNEWVSTESIKSPKVISQ